MRLPGTKPMPGKVNKKQKAAGCPPAAFCFFKSRVPFLLGRKFTNSYAIAMGVAFIIM